MQTLADKSAAAPLATQAHAEATPRKQSAAPTEVEPAKTPDTKTLSAKPTAALHATQAPANKSSTKPAAQTQVSDELPEKPTPRRLTGKQSPSKEPEGKPAKPAETAASQETMVDPMYQALLAKIASLENRLCEAQAKQTHAPAPTTPACNRRKLSPGASSRPSTKQLRHTQSTGPAGDFSDESEHEDMGEPCDGDNVVVSPDGSIASWI